MNMKYFLITKNSLHYGLIKTWGTAVEKAIRGAHSGLKSWKRDKKAKILILKPGNIWLSNHRVKSFFYYIKYTSDFNIWKKNCHFLPLREISYFLLVDCTLHIVDQTFYCKNIWDIKKCFIQKFYSKNTSI